MVTLQQLKYAVIVADCGSINEAAKCLMISQPSLSNAVKELENEIGIIYLSEFNEPVIGKLLRENDLIFEELFHVKPHVFISKTNPLSKKNIVTWDDLKEIPCLNFDQGERNSFYFSEEVLSTRNHKRNIRVTDRAAVVNMLIGVDAFLIGTGVFPDYLHGNDIIAIPLEANEENHVH